MPRRKKSRRRKRKQGGGGEFDSIKQPARTYAEAIPISKKKQIFAKVVPVPSNSKGGLKEPLINKPQSISKTKKLKNIYEKGKNILQGFTLEYEGLWAIWFVAIVIYSISISIGITKSVGGDMVLATYGILLACTLFICFARYLSKKGGGDDVSSSIMNIFKTMIPLLSSIAGLLYIIITYSNNLKIISNIGKHVEELSIFNNFIAVMSFLQVSRLISYFKRMGTKQTQNLLDYVIFTLSFIVQITLTIILSNKLESYRTDG